MNPAISIIVATRRRTEMLYKLLQSLQRTVRYPNTYEVILRFSNDDLRSRDEFLRHKLCWKLSRNLRIITGEPLRGFGSLGEFLSQLSDVSRGRWLWPLSDDCTIDGKAWDEQIIKTPTTGFVLYPQFDKLDKSIYREVSNGPFPAVPRDCWKQFGCPRCPEPPDYALNEILIKKNGWKPRFLQGITVIHEREKAKAFDAAYV